MVAWLKPFLLALLLALLAHALTLMLIGAQMPVVGSVLQQRDDPLFTRTISSASTAPVAPAVPEAPPPPALTAAPSQVLKPTPTVAKVTPSMPEPSSTVSVAEAVSPSSEVAVSVSLEVSATPTATVTEATPEPSSTVALTETPTSVQNSNPTGGTGGLLVTGEWPADTRVTYKLTGYYLGELHGNGRVQWTRSGEQREKYQVRVDTHIPGLFKFAMTSQGRVSAQGLLPEAYEETTDRTGAKVRVRAIRLEQQEVVLNNGTRLPRPAAEPMAVQDAVSQFIDLGHRFVQGRDRLEAGNTVRVWLGRPGGLDEWIYDVDAAETLQLPSIGPVQVHRLRPRPLVNARGTIAMEMWLAPSLQYLPAKIRITLNAESYVELTALQIEQN